MSKDNSAKEKELLARIEELEQALRQAQDNSARVERLVENTIEGLLLHDHGLAIDMNPSFAHIFGYTVEELAGKNLIEQLIAKTSQQVVINNIQAKVTSPYEVIAVRKDGTQFPAEIEGRTVGYEGKELRAVAVRDISDRKTTRDNLKNSESLLNDVQELSKAGGWRYIVDTEEMIWTKELYRIHDFDENDYSIDHIAESINCYLPKDREIIQKVFQDCIEKGIGYDLEFEFNTTKQKKFIRTKTKPILENGRVVEVLGSVMDITELAQAEQKLLEIQDDLKTERDFNKLINKTIPIGIIILDREGKIIYANPKAEETLGQTKENLLQTTYNSPSWKITDFDGNKFDQKNLPFAMVKKTHQPVTNIEHAIETVEGKRVFLSVNANPRFNRKAEFDGIIASIEDITDQVAAEKSLLSSERRINFIINQLPIIVWATDRNLMFTYSEGADLDSLGLRPNQAVEDKFDLYRFFRTRSDENIAIKYHKLAIEGKTSSYDMEFGGKYRQSFVGPLKNKNDEIIGTMGFSIDITQQKQYQQELIIAKEKAEESDKLKMAFLENLSHEVRTPMNGIMGFSEMLIQKNLSPEMRERYVDIIKDSTRQLLKVIEDIIEISRIKTEEVHAQENTCSINAIMLGLYSEFKPVADLNNLEFYHQSDLPDSESIVTTDETKVTKILKHLIVNAIKFTREGYVKIAYSIEKESIIFSVEDTGTGIEKSIIEKMFEPFQKTKFGARNFASGTGVGLAIVDAYVKVLKGRITVETETEKGTTFFIEIPYRPIEVKSQDKAGHVPVHKRGIALVAEDEIINYMILEKFLNREGFKVLHAKNGQEALDFVKEIKDITIVMLDIRMPLMDGYQVVTEIKNIRPELPIIAQTAYVLHEGRDKILKAGFDGYLPKPIDFKQLKLLIKSLL